MTTFVQLDIMSTVVGCQLLTKLESVSLINYTMVRFFRAPVCKVGKESYNIPSLKVAKNKACPMCSVCHNILITTIPL